MIAWISAARSIVPFAHRSQGRRRELAVDRIHDDANGGHGETAYCGDARHHIVDRECARAYMQRALRPRCAAPVLPIAIGRPSSPPHRPLPKQPVNAPRKQTACAEIPIASDAKPPHTSRGFLPWRLRTPAPACAAPPSWGRHPQTFTSTDNRAALRDRRRCTYEHYSVSETCRPASPAAPATGPLRACFGQGQSPPFFPSHRTA
ncbi:hypothetical protein ACVWVY_002710 [Bradyrhizobium sp. URHC0002]|jgi:hypothetical protein